MKTRSARIKVTEPCFNSPCEEQSKIKDILIKRLQVEVDKFRNLNAKLLDEQKENSAEFEKMCNTNSDLKRKLTASDKIISEIQNKYDTQIAKVSMYESEYENLHDSIVCMHNSGKMTAFEESRIINESFLNDTIFENSMLEYRNKNERKSLTDEICNLQRENELLKESLKEKKIAIEELHKKLGVKGKFPGKTSVVPVLHVSAVVGEPASLPCDISTPDPDDAVLLVLWYREDLGTPIYSVDARERDFTVAERWSDEGAFASRAYFVPAPTNSARLAVQRARSEDKAVYRCRVDFRRAQTRNSRVNLTVIVPPARVVITDGAGVVRSTVVGPFVEGDDVTLHCAVYEGDPSPWIRWYRDGEEVKAEYDAQANRATLSLRALSRDDVRAELVCRSNNNDKTPPLEAALHLDMNLEPLTVHILGAGQELSAGRRYDLLCQSSGSRPPATVTWWRDEQRFDHTKETISFDGNTTTSTLSMVVSRADAGRRLACRAHNAALPSRAAPLEDTWTIDVHYIPSASVRLGASLNPRDIREGSDVYFDCVLVAHPRIYKVEWRHNGNALKHAVGAGVIIANQSLVLQGVTRHSAGNYTCVGYNSEGDGESGPFQLDVLFAPTCSARQERLHGVARHERAHIECRVDANPPDVKFRWTFNNSAENMDVASSTQHEHALSSSSSTTSTLKRAEAMSTLQYTPTAERDYGTLLCWADNRVGAQRVPCVFHVIAAGHPDQVNNCSLQNVSSSSFAVRCSEGFNGGLPQSFLLEVWDTETQELKVNMSSAWARFASVGLAAGRGYMVAVSAYNSKGRAAPTRLLAHTAPHPEPQHTTHHDAKSASSSPLVTAWRGACAVGALGVLALVVLLLRTLRSRRNEHMRGEMFKEGSRARAGRGRARGFDTGATSCRSSRLRATITTRTPRTPPDENDENNPDLIPEADDEMQVFPRLQRVATIEPRAPADYCALPTMQGGSVTALVGTCGLAAWTPPPPDTFATPPRVRHVQEYGAHAHEHARHEHAHGAHTTHHTPEHADIAV